MEVKILELYDRAERVKEVRFLTDYGSAKAEWIGTEPQVPHSYDVELEINEELAWGRNINRVDGDGFRIDYRDNVVLLQGKLESLLPDGFGTVRIGRSIVLIETTGEAPPTGVTVRIEILRLRVFPTNT